MVVKDHLGNTYKAQKEMCDFHGVSYDVYLKRLENGWSLEDSLTKPIKKKVGNKDD